MLGLRIISGYLSRSRQEAAAAILRKIIAQAPLYTPCLQSGRPMSVKMTNCGPLGWLTDARGYRYEPRHPETGKPWPPMPEFLLAAWHDLSDYPHPPEAWLVNFFWLE